MSRKGISVYDMVVVGLMAAMVFVCTMFLGIKIPTPTGTTMLKTANAVCLLGGLLFGGWRGGLAAGIGSAFFDLTYPEFAAGAPLTFLRFFLMAFICGSVARMLGGREMKPHALVLGAVAGGVFDSLFYISKSVLTLVIAGSAFMPALVATSPKIVTNVVNTCFAIVVSVVLSMVLYPRLKQAGLLKHFAA